MMLLSDSKNLENRKRLNMKKKRRKLKKWCEVLLVFVSIIAFFVCGSDSYNLKDFVLTHFIAISIFIIANYLLYKYSDLFKD